ncbi:hypothetical protein CBL_12531 [Carabus blaptoides fortunei]
MDWNFESLGIMLHPGPKLSNVPALRIRNHSSFHTNLIGRLRFRFTELKLQTVVSEQNWALCLHAEPELQNDKMNLKAKLRTLSREISQTCSLSSALDGKNGGVVIKRRAQATKEMPEEATQEIFKRKSYT